jgi:hypothetical protein
MLNDIAHAMPWQCMLALHVCVYHDIYGNTHNDSVVDENAQVQCNYKNTFAATIKQPSLTL